MHPSLRVLSATALLSLAGSLFAQGGNVTTAHTNPAFDALLDPDADGFVTESGAAFLSGTTEADEFEVIASSVTGWVEIFDSNEAGNDD